MRWVSEHTAVNKERAKLHHRVPQLIDPGRARCEIAQFTARSGYR